MESIRFNRSIANAIITQHGQLRDSDEELIESILIGDTEHNALLILDGYDMYKRGTNVAIDKAIESGLGNTVIMITAPDEEGILRKSTDAVVTVQGLSEEGIIQMADMYLENTTKRELMLQQTKDLDISDLLHVPVMLAMICVIFNEHNSLPKSQFEVVGLLYELLMHRIRHRMIGCGYLPLDSFEPPWNRLNLLSLMAEFAWRTLHDTESLPPYKVSL